MYHRPGRLWIPEAPHLCTQRHREVEVHTPTVGFVGIITVEKVHARTGVVVQRETSRNIITDAGLNALGAGVNSSTDSGLVNAMWVHCAVGTGSATPAATDTGLASELARTNSQGGIADQQGFAGDTSYHWFRRTHVFTPSQANGNLTEVGYFSLSTGGVMWSRQLIKDASGNPTVITKTSEYELRVIYEVRMTIPTADILGTITIDGSSHDTVLRPGLISISQSYWLTQNFRGNQPDDMAMSGAYTGGLGTTGQLPGGTRTDASVRTGAAYTVGSFYRDLTSEWGSTAANYTIASFHVSHHPLWQFSINPTITKVDTKKLVLNHRTSWGRA